MQQARFAIAYRLPDLLLEREGSPGTAGKPALSEALGPVPSPRPLSRRERGVIMWLPGIFVWHGSALAPSPFGRGPG
ncbi:hypothetical protein PSTAB_2644 [Stutzerimonas stutzeri]|uniref:Uncharacterized protein n=1 Tax=Stutzerimonas stutzeri (strain ATCC 17588 / DSM 5190 / CCUG 11256 / JCM 5965 / LMG 11199 / NBRC 14165 / NCIMB 11358 / Stanier 221) TaxID=96563 RepID=F8H3X6_STUS2|nr:hypothetical protein PSTAB_2644 [Stutzerimonas stutzeri]